MDTSINVTITQNVINEETGAKMYIFNIAFFGLFIFV